MVLQTPRPFAEMTVRENVVLGAMFGSVDGRPQRVGGVRPRRARRSASSASPSRGDDDVGTLNLHEQRFVELARALAGRPRLLLLDEVMAGLNDTELHASIDIVRTARDRLGVTVIWVEHVMKAVLSLAERIVVLELRRLLADGAPRDVMRDPEVVDGLPRRAAAADRWRCSRSLTCRRATSARTSSTVPRCRSTRARSWPSSGPTAPARRRCSAPSAGCCGRPRRGALRRTRHQRAVERTRSPASDSPTCPPSATCSRR